jgi:hypothetical protein
VSSPSDQLEGTPSSQPEEQAAEATQELAAGSEDLQPPGGLIPPVKLPFDPDAYREKMRGYVALILLGQLLVTITLPWLALWWQWTDVAGAKEILTIILAPVSGLVGAATGFYFGEKVARRLS